MKYPMTPAGYASLRRELLKLKGMRVELAEAIEVARGHGDLSENGDYDAAKERSGMTEAKVRDLEARLASSEVIDPLSIKEPPRVMFGVTVILEGVETGEERRYTIVGTEESDIQRGYISYDSPIGRAMIGKELGDIARVQAPGGIREYEIRDILVDYQNFLGVDE